jgi:hypothetical protein
MTTIRRRPTAPATRARPVRARDAPAGPSLEHRIMPRDDTCFGLRTNHKLSTAENTRESIIVGKLGVRNRIVLLDMWVDTLDSNSVEIYWGQTDTMVQASADQALFLLPFNYGTQGSRQTFWWPVGTGPVGILPESLSARRVLNILTQNFYWTVWWTEEKQ